MHDLIAQVTTLPSTGQNAPAQFSELNVLFGNVVSVVLGFSGLVLFIMLVLGGIKYISAGSDPKAVEGAKKTLTYAIAGLVLVALAFLIIRVIEFVTGVNVSNFSVVGS